MGTEGEVLCESEVAALAAEVEGELLAGCGLEIHPFLTGWYDELVGEKFHFDRPPDTLALLVISQPAMFERTFLPYLAATPRDKLHDPIGIVQEHRLPERIKSDGLVSICLRLFTGRLTAIY